MSGLEIAGLVLGALSLAIEVLDRYEEVANCIDIFFKIRAEYEEWRSRLEFNDLLYKRNIQDLLLPLMIDDKTEEDKIPKLMRDPFGSWWTEPEMAHHLQERLRDGYKVYMKCIKVMQQVMEEIVRELALGHAAVQSKISTSREATIIARLKTLRDSDNLSFQKFRFKFAIKGPRKRTLLFSKLEEHNRKLREILKGSDRIRDLSAQTLATASTKPVSVDTALCSFWKQADKFFNALASSWNCRCNTHCANLLLRHRSNATSEFEVLFTKEQPSLATWNARKTKIVGKQGINLEPKEDAECQISLPKHAPSPKASRPLKSAMGKPENSRRKTARAMIAGFQSSPTTIMTVVAVKQEDNLTITSTVPTKTTTTTQIIQSLCAALETPASSANLGDPSYGYFIKDGMSYHIYDIPYSQPTEPHTLVTLQSIIDDRAAFHSLQRKQRYSIALTIASSFVQLLNSPWLPTTLAKTDIIFIRDSNTYTYLDEPYVQRPVVPPGTKTAGSPEQTEPVTTSQALDQLGIILLELCFGKRLRDQKCRQDYEKGCPAPDDRIRTLYDVLAARAWQHEVSGEAGEDFAAAVAWCLGGNGATACAQVQERWRKDMLGKVVGPLKMCCDYLAGRRLED